MLALIERLRNFARQYRVDSTYDDQYYRVRECDHVTGINIAVTHKKIIFSRRIMMHRFSRIDNHPNTIDKNLYSNQHTAYY